MLIKSQDDSAIYDLDKVLSVYAVTNNDGLNIVYALSYAGELAFPLGEYKTLERAKDIVGEIFAVSNSQSLYEMPIV